MDVTVISCLLTSLIYLKFKGLDISKLWILYETYDSFVDLDSQQGLKFEYLRLCHFKLCRYFVINLSRTSLYIFLSLFIHKALIW